MIKRCSCHRLPARQEIPCFCLHHAAACGARIASPNARRPSALRHLESPSVRCRAAPAAAKGDGVAFTGRSLGLPELLPPLDTHPATGTDWAVTRAAHFLPRTQHKQRKWGAQSSSVQQDAAQPSIFNRNPLLSQPAHNQRCTCSSRGTGTGTGRVGRPRARQSRKVIV